PRTVLGHLVDCPSGPGSGVAPVATGDGQGGRDGLDAAVQLDELPRLPLEAFVPDRRADGGGKDVDQAPPPDDVDAGVGEDGEFAGPVVELDGEFVTEAQR